MVARYLEIATQLLAEIEVPLDRLPYTDDFEPIYERFQDLAGKSLDRHEVWWSLLSARKRGRGHARLRRRSMLA